MRPIAGAEIRPTPTENPVKRGVLCVRNSTNPHLARGNPTSLWTIDNTRQIVPSLGPILTKIMCLSRSMQFLQLRNQLIKKAKKEAEKKYQRKLQK